MFYQLNQLPFAEKKIKYLFEENHKIEEYIDLNEMKKNSWRVIVQYTLLHKVFAA